MKNRSRFLIIGAAPANANGFATGQSPGQYGTMHLTSLPRISYIGEMFTAHATVLTLSLASFLLTGALLRLLRPARK